MIVEATKPTIAEAARNLIQGQLVAFPTETVYGLGADARNGEAVAAIFALKRRPSFNPLIVHVTDRDMAARYCQLSDTAERLIEAYWPGPLTIIAVQSAECGIASLATAGLKTVALRAPAHPTAQQLLQAAQCPIAAPSANVSGYISPTRADHVEADLGDGPSIILKGGPACGGLESSIIDTTLDPPELLRSGMILALDIGRFLGLNLTAKQSGEIRAPGQLASHYAPRAKLRLNAFNPRSGEALLAFGPKPPAGAEFSINLSVSGNLQEAAANLFNALRELDLQNADAVAVMPIPAHGLGIAINDRLTRAAAQ